ncbi:MAG: DUF1499 domain-containing protein [Granulosicoccus sp.]|nr:DUF1499 domain-containing protein [Granulosicoccus sp.]
MKLLIVVAVLLLVAVAVRLAVPKLSQQSVASGVLQSNGVRTLGDCPDTPNCQGSRSSRAEQQVEPMIINQELAQAIASIASVVRAQPGTAIVSQTDHYLHATFTSRLMGYIDDVEFLVDEDGKSVQVRSASRLGVSDLGVNAKRIAFLREQLLAVL